MIDMIIAHRSTFTKGSNTRMQKNINNSRTPILTVRSTAVSRILSPDFDVSLFFSLMTTGYILSKIEIFFHTLVIVDIQWPGFIELQ